MGFVDSSNVPALPVYFNLVRGVGVDCPNNYEDVLLVQHLLVMFYDKQNPSLRPKGAMKLDGSCGPITCNWIQKFQLDCNKMSGTIVLVVDGRMDRARNRNLIGTLTGKVYGIAVLNYNARNANGIAWSATPYLIPMSYSTDVPPPTDDYIPPFQTVPTTGGA